MEKASETHVVLGKLIRQLRKERGMRSQEELAKQSEMHRTYVGGIERGEHDFGLMTLRRIAAALDLRASELLALLEERER